MAPSTRSDDVVSRSRRVRFLERLASPRMPLVAALVAFVVALPTLAAGYFIDDRYHEYVLRGNAPPGGAHGVWDLYRFADGSPAFVKGVRSGWFPWWTSLELRLAFFRPLASLWRWADFRLFGLSATIPHLETCAVYALLAFVVARAYREWVGGAAAGLAAIAYAIDDGHATPVTWISNRYAILAALFGMAALFAHIRSRSRPGPSALGRRASPLLLSLALLSGETALGVLGYLVGYAWFVDEAGKRSAFLSLAPHAVVSGAWVIAYRTMGYGVTGSSFYVDPARSPALFASKFPLRFPELVASGVFGPPSEAWTLVPPERAVFAAIVAAVVGAGVLAIVIRLAWRAEAARKTIRALLFGAAASLVPVCATIPDDRNFMIAGFGFFGVLAIAIDQVWREGRNAPRLRRFAIGALVTVHLVLAPLLFPARGLNMALGFGGFIRRGATTIPTGERTRGKTLVMVGVPDSLIMLYMFLERMLEPGPRPSDLTVLTVQTAGSYTVRSIDADTVEIDNPIGELHSMFAAVYSDKPYAAGQVFDRDIDHVEVLAVTPTGEPSSIRATLPEPPNERIWMVWKDQGLVEIPPPQPGETLTFQGVDLFTAMKH